MKKLKKINLELNKEVVSNLSNDNLNQVKGGATQGSNDINCCHYPITVQDNTCKCPASALCGNTNILNPCQYTVDNCAGIYTQQAICTVETRPNCYITV